MPFRMILFDFFNTLVVSDPSRLPRMEVEGKVVVSTAEVLRAHLAPHAPQVDARQVHRAMEAARVRMREGWGPEMRERPGLERFVYLLTVLGVPDPDGALAAELLDAHMGQVTGSFTFPEAHRELLRRLSATHRMGIFSNFDCADALHGVLAKYAIRDWFEPVLISETLGFRKPGQAAFRHALARLPEPVEHILFVGDSLKDDVRGARQVGMAVAWINLTGEEAPADCRPTHELRALPELLDLLNGATPPAPTGPAGAG